MNDDQRKTAGVVQTPEAANVLPFEKRARSVAACGHAGKTGVFDPDSPESLLRHAWALLPVKARGATLAKFIMGCADTQASRTHVAELTPDLRMQVRESYSGALVAESAPLLPAGKGPRS